jgi:pullulanase/glycogen debranching enzyme
MMKSRVIDTAFSWGKDQHLQTSWEKTVIYEAHVKGFTMRHPPFQPTSAAPMPVSRATKPSATSARLA